MYPYNYILLAGFTCLFFNVKTKEAATTFLIGWGVYLVAVYGTDFRYYFLLSATIELAIAYKLNSRYRVISYISYSLILVNIFGLILHINGIKWHYDFVYALLSIIQFLFLLARVIPDGISELHSKHIVVRCLNYDSGQAYGKMYRNTPTSKKNSCQAK